MTGNVVPMLTVWLGQNSSRPGVTSFLELMGAMGPAVCFCFLTTLVNMSEPETAFLYQFRKQFKYLLRRNDRGVNYSWLLFYC